MKEDQNQTSLIMSMVELKELFETAKKSIIINTENEQVLAQVNDVINMLSARTIAKSPKLIEEQTKFLYTEFLPGIAKRILTVKSNKDSYIKLITEVINSLLNLLNVELEAKTATLDDLAESCRVLFDPTQKFYTSHNQKVFEEEAKATQENQEKSINSGSIPTANLSQLSSEDRLWRNSLKANDLIDVVKYDQNFNLKAWSVGKIDSIVANNADGGLNLGDEKGVNIKTFKIGYYKDISIAQRLVRADEPIIAPYLSKTNSEKWRVNLYKGQQVDAMSNNSTWFRATVIEPDPRIDAIHKNAKIGFREYNSLGDKEDEMGKFFGFSKNVDEHIGYYSLRIQPLGTYTDSKGVNILSCDLPIEKYPQPTQTTSQTSTSYSKSEVSPQYKLDQRQDESDMLELENNEIKFVTERKQYRNTNLVEIINNFGKAQGFENILGAIQASESSIELLIYLIDCLGKISILFHKSFIDNYLERLRTAVLQKIINANQTQIRSMKQIRMEELVNTMWDKIMSRLLNVTQVAIQKNIFNFEIGALFMKQNFLERRIDGARIIDGICKQSLMNNTFCPTLKDGIQKNVSLTSLLLTELQKHEILERYFSKRNVHSQLIQRSTNVLKVLISQNALNQDQLEMIWTSVDQFDDMRFEFYSVFKDISTAINPGQLYFFIQKICKLPQASIKIVELELMERIISGQKQEDAAAKVNLACGLEFFWNYMNNIESSKNFDQLLIKKAILCFSDIIKHANLDIVDLYFDKITANLSNDKQSYTQIKILFNYFNDFTVGSKASSAAASNVENQGNTETESKSEDGKPTEFEQINTSKILPTSKYDFINLVNQKHNLFDMLFDELKRYMSRAKTVICPLIQAIPEEKQQEDIPKLSENTIVEFFPHKLQIDLRLKFIHYIAVHSATVITKQLLSIIWDQLITGNQIFGDHQILFKWLREILDDCLRAHLGLIDETELIDFFKTKIVAEDTDDDYFKNLSIEGYYCIQSFFLLINQKNRKLYILSDDDQDTIPNKDGQNNTMDSDTQALYAQNAVKTFTSYSSSTGAQTKSYSFNKNQTQPTQNEKTNSLVITQTDPDLLEVVVRAAPHELEGIRGLWRIAINCNDKKVSESVAILLLQLHTQVDFELKSRISEFENQFILSCISLIQNNMLQIEQRDPNEQAAFNLKYKETSEFSHNKILPVQEKRIVRCLTYIKMLIQNSEKDGMRGSRPHSCLKPAEDILLHIHNSFKIGQQYRQRFQIKVPNNTTIFDLKKFIGTQLVANYNADGLFYLIESPVHPCSLKITRSNNQNKTISDNENGTTLAELNFKTGEVFTVLPKAYNSTSKYPLLNDEKTDLNARAIDIFTQIFLKYAIEDIDKPEEGLFMRNIEVVNFIKGSTNESQGCDITDSRVFTIMKFDSNNDGKMTLQDFLNFYKISCTQKGNMVVVRNNLKNHGFRQDLQQTPRPGQDYDILQIRQSIQDMPRFKLAQNPVLLQMLFKLLSFQSEVNKEAIKTIKLLNTNLEKFWTLLWLKERPQNVSQEFNWDIVFKKENLHETAYVLEILESFLVNDYSQLDQNCDEALLRNTWVNNFIEFGGFKELINLLNVAENVAKEATLDDIPGTQINKMKKNFLVQLLRIISIFVLGAFHASKTEQDLEKFTVLKRLQYQNSDKNDKTDATQKTSTKADEIFKTPQKAQTGIPFVNAGNDVSIGPELPPGFQGKEGVDASMITTEFLFGESNSKPSSEQELKAQEDKKGEVQKQTDSQNVTQNTMFTKIVAQIKQKQQSEFVFASIDFSKLQNQILEIITLILTRNQTWLLEDNEIIKSAMDLWVVCMIEFPKIKTEFYQWTREPEPIIEPVQETTQEDIKKKKKPIKPLVITNAKELVIGGLFSNKGQVLRKKFQETFEMICEKVSDNISSERPLFWFLNHLLDKSPVWDGQEDTKTNCSISQEFFQLITNLVLQYKEEFQIGKEKEGDKSQHEQEVSTGKQMIDFEVLIISTIEKMKQHQSMDGLLEDKTQSGYMILLKELLTIFIDTQDYEKFIALEEKTQLLHELFFENLFFLPGKTKNPKQNKCVHKESRINAYKLLYRYTKSFKPKEMNVFLEEYLWYFIKDVPRPLKWRHTPSELGRSTHCGIKNLGNICYMISMLQQFYMIPQFRYQLLRAEDDKSVEAKEVQYKGNKLITDDNLLHQLQKLFQQLETSQRREIDPTEFCYSYKDFDGEPTNTALQCDAQEFLNFFFDRIENALKPTSQKYLLQDVFQGCKVKQRTCKNCGHIDLQSEDFYTLSLQVKNKTGVYESLTDMVKGEEINDYKCDGCKQKVDLQSIEMLGETPNVLIVHLQRICFSFETFNNVKINTSFDFPDILDLKQYSFGEIMKKQGKTEENFAQNQKLKDLMNVDQDEYIYRLVGVNIHRGTGTHGHYWSLINTQRGLLEKDPEKEEKEWKNVEKCDWKEFNDESVTFFNFKNIQGESFGGDKSAVKDDELAAFQSEPAGNYGKSAYMLVYERKKKKMIREVQVIDGQSEPIIKKIDYRSIQKYVQEKLQQKVLKENTDFVIDKQIFNAQFFFLVKMTLSTIVSEGCYAEYRFSHQYKLDGHFNKMKGLALQIGQKVMFDFLSHFYENATMQPIQDSMCGILTFSDSYIAYARETQPSVILEFIKRTYLADNCDYFFEIMFKCVDQSARNWIGTLTSNVISKALRIYALCQEEEDQKQNPRVQELGKAVDEFVSKCILKLKDRECQKQWNSLKQYFEFISNFGRSGKYQTKYLLEKFDLVADLADFMLGDKSPRRANEKENRVSMGGSTNMPAFAPLVKLISHLVRASKTKIMTNMEDQPKTFVLFKDERDNDKEKIPLEQEFIISDEAQNLITSNEFIDLVMKQEYETEDFGKALAHLQFGDKNLSKKICMFLLKNIVISDYDKISSYLDVVEEIVLVQEKIGGKKLNLQRKRLEWIFGVPLMNSFQSENKFRIGLDSIFHNIKGEVFEYKSMLTFDPKNDDCFLHLLWRYQGRMDNYTITALEYLLSIAISDDDISEYFAQLPPVTYQYARYTDWIKPYLQSQLAKANAGYGSAVMLGNKELIVKVMSLYEQFEAFLKEKSCEKVLELEPAVKDEKGKDINRKLKFNKIQAEKSENIENAEDEEMKSQLIDTSKVYTQNSDELIQTTPPPFIILKNIDENYICQISADNANRPDDAQDGVNLTISELNCTYMSSKPTGFVNKAVPDSYLNKYNLKQPQAPQDEPKSFGTSAAAMLQKREQMISSESNQLQGEGVVIQDSNEQWNNINNDGGNMADHESDAEEEKGYTCDKEESILDRTQPSVSNSKQKMLDELFDLQFIKQEIPKNAQLSLHLDDSFENWQGEKIQNCLDLVYKFTVSNTTDQPIQFRIKLKAKNPSSEINLYWPVTGIRGSIPAQQTAIVALLPKLRPLNRSDQQLSEFEKLDVKLWWKIDAIKASLLKTSQNKQAVDSKVIDTNKKEKIVAFSEDVQQIGVSNNAESVYGPTNQVGTDFNDFNYADFAGVGDEKSCLACTFLNPVSATRCSCCDTLF